jgi:hypothetical protein
MEVTPPTPSGVTWVPRDRGVGRGLGAKHRQSSIWCQPLHSTTRDVLYAPLGHKYLSLIIGFCKCMNDASEGVAKLVNRALGGRFNCGSIHRGQNAPSFQPEMKQEVKDGAKFLWLMGYHSNGGYF